jgi:hypothetical protein
MLDKKAACNNEAFAAASDTKLKAFERSLAS